MVAEDAGEPEPRFIDEEPASAEISVTLHYEDAVAKLSLTDPLRMATYKITDMPWRERALFLV